MSSVKLYNEDNITICKNLYDNQLRFNFIYADCIYESRNFDWLYYAKRLLAEDGIFIVQTDYHTAATYHSYLNSDATMRFVNWLIYINNWGGVPHNRFAQKHDDILVFSNSGFWKWHPERIQIPKATAGTSFDKKGTGTKTPPSVFYDHASFSTIAGEREKYEGKNIQWQKPEWLMERLLLPFTDTGDSVLDLFMGSGTLGVVSVKNNRHYTGIEIDSDVFDIAENRIDKYNVNSS